MDSVNLKKDLSIPHLIQMWECRDTQTMMPPEEWGDIILILQKLLPEYAVRDFTNLENDHCYIVEVLLHEGQTSFLDDGLDLLGKARVLQTFVSHIAPYYYYYVWEMSPNEADGNLAFTYPKRAQLSRKDMSRPELNVYLPVSAINHFTRAPQQRLFRESKPNALIKAK